MKDPIYWIRRLEIRMQAANIKSQWWKRITFETNLPPDIGHKLKDLFAKEEGEDAQIYKTCKTRFVKLYAPKHEDDVKKARSLVMTDTPSEAAKELRELLCKKPKHLEGCCCGPIVTSFWRDLLPEPVRQAVANMDLSATTFEATVDHADKAFASMNKGATVAAVNLDETQPALQQPVAAFNRGNTRARNVGAGRRDKAGGEDRDGEADAQTPATGALGAMPTRTLPALTHPQEFVCNITFTASVHIFAVFVTVALGAILLPHLMTRPETAHSTSS